MRVLNVIVLLASAALLLCAQTAHAWWCLGRMATAQAAKSQMKPATIDYVETVIDSLSKAGPFPNAPDMVQVACWADDVKSPMNLKMMNDWHFIDQKFSPDNYPIPDHPLPNGNVAKVINQLYSGIKANRANPTGWAMGFAVSNIIHFIGDIHQPLHATELFSAEYPTGDMGGNKETVYVNGEKTNLHFLWDSICWTWNDDLPRPLSKTDMSRIVTYTDSLLTKYNVTAKEAGTYDPMVMAQESFDMAVNTVYPGITDGVTISKEYLDKCIPAAERRVVLGGIRLGRQLQFLLGNYAEEWAMNKQKNIVDETLEEKMLNKTRTALTFMRERFELTLRLRAEKLNIQHLKRKVQ